MNKKIYDEKQHKQYTLYYCNTHLLPRMKGNMKTVKIGEGLYADVINPDIIDEMFPIVFIENEKGEKEQKVLLPKGYEK